MSITFTLFFRNRVWEYGGYASKGLEQVAKWGSPRALESELKSQSLHIRTIIKARGLWFPNHNGKTFAVFRTDRKNHLVSLVKSFYVFCNESLK